VETKAGCASSSNSEPPADASTAPAPSADSKPETGMLEARGGGMSGGPGRGGGALAADSAT
jgi:hypothetical protein